jgi:hypothetical protein
MKSSIGRGPKRVQQMWQVGKKEQWYEDAHGFR